MTPYIRRGPVRARDLRANITELGFEQGVAVTLEALLDEHTQDRQNMRDMAQMLDQCIDKLSEFIALSEGLQKRMMELKRTNDQGDAIDHADS